MRRLVTLLATVAIVCVARTPAGATADSQPHPPKLPRWEHPAPFALGAASDAATSVAAPLLAGFSVTLIGVVAQSPQSFRWPGLAILGLTIVAATFTAALQLGFWARQYLYSRSDIEQWRDLAAEPLWIVQHLIEQQRRHYGVWTRYRRKARLAYNMGVCGLGVAVALVVAPPGSYADGTIVPATESTARWAGTLILTSLSILELAWVFHVTVRRPKGRRKDSDD